MSVYQTQARKGAVDRSIKKSKDKKKIHKKLAMKSFLVRNLCPSNKPKSRKMEEAAISSVIQKLQNYQTNEEIKRIIKETKEILKIMRKKKRLVDARRLNFLASDLVHAASDALRLFEHSQSYYIDPEMEPIHRWIGEIKIRVAEITESSDNDDDDDEDDVQHLIGLEKDMEIYLRSLWDALPIEYNGTQH
ncbi:hypothetical protein AAHA92_12932 [Salvia divinorum]|uniref:Uncharacterized protein n=1 Tax=Salvia divinorum TaxID=28513 RepID=A0ABD1H7E3_SALDI